MGAAELPVVATRIGLSWGRGLQRDGKTDILWRHAASGQNVIWYMNDANIMDQPSCPRWAT